MELVAPTICSGQSFFHLKNSVSRTFHSFSVHTVLDILFVNAVETKKEFFFRTIYSLALKKASDRNSCRDIKQHFDIPPRGSVYSPLLLREAVLSIKIAQRDISVSYYDIYGAPTDEGEKKKENHSVDFEPDGLSSTAILKRKAPKKASRAYNINTGMTGYHWTSVVVLKICCFKACIIGC